MTQATHTPGPWAVNASDCAMIGISRPLPDWPTGFHDKIADVILTSRPDENAANAALISAAPDMLAALELALRNAESRLYMAAPLGASYGQPERASIESERNIYAATIAKAKAVQS